MRDSWNVWRSKVNLRLDEYDPEVIIGIFEQMELLNEKMTILRADMTTAKNDIATLKGQMTTANGNISTLQSNVGTNTSDISTLKSDMTTVKSDITTLQGDMTTAKGNITTLQGDMTSAQGNISTLQSDMTTAKSNITTLQGDMTTAQGNISTIQGNVTTMQGDISSLQSSVGTNSNNITSLQGRMSTAENNITSLQTAVNGLGTASTKNVPVSGNASTTEVVMGDDTRLSNSRTPTAHASGTAGTYGAGTSANYGHVKLSNAYTSSGGTADQSVGASSKAVNDAYTALNASKLTMLVTNRQIVANGIWSYNAWGGCILTAYIPHVTGKTITVTNAVYMDGSSTSDITSTVTASEQNEFFIEFKTTRTDVAGKYANVTFKLS